MLDWNRLYGRRGMLQYQCVIPRGNERDAIGALLDVITASGQASFLAVLKTFGDLPSPGLLSFSRAGATLALDFPYRGEVTLNLMAQLDAIVSEAGGALYPAKDGRMTRELFRRSFPDGNKSLEIRPEFRFLAKGGGMNGQGERIVILGAASAIAEATARLWAARGARISSWSGSDATRLEAIAADLNDARRGARRSLGRSIARR